MVRNQENVDNMITQKLNKIQEAVSNLDFQTQLAFMYLISQRQLNNYIVFSKHYKTGNPDIVTQAIKLMRDFIFNKVDLQQVEEVKDFVENEAPDLEDFPGNILASFALNTCSLIYECLEYITDKDTERIEVIISSSIRTIETYMEIKLNIDQNLSIEETEKILFEQDIIKDEIKYQENLVSTLYLINKIDIHFLELIELVEDKTSKQILSEVSNEEEITI